MQIRRLADTLKKRVRELPPHIVLAIGFALFLLWAYPGYMSTDSVVQLQEARAVKFSDGNPPSMALIWALLDRIVSGPLLMLLLQGLVFLGGLYVVLQRVLSQRAAAWAAIGIFLFPPVLTPMAVIWKDSQMAAYLIAGTALLVQPRLRVRLGGLALLALACLMRHNALAAAAPIIGFVFEWRRPIAWWKRIGLVVAAAVLALGVLLGVNRVLASRHVRLTPVFYDVMAMVAFTHDRSDAELEYILRDAPLATHEHIQERARKAFELRGVYRTITGEEHFFNYPTTEAQWDALYRSWKDLIRDDPGAYFRSHWVVFARLLGITELPRAPVYNLFIEAPTEQVQLVDHDASWSTAQVLAGRALYWLADNTPLYRPWVYAVIALVLLVLCCRDRLTFALYTSGLLYELSFLPPFAEPDSRYSHWMITSVCVATVILFVQRYRAKSTS